MPLSFLILLGLLILVVGATFFFVTRYKKAAVVVMVIGVAVSILTFLLIVLAVNSSM
jgi:hypothetical protein